MPVGVAVVRGAKGVPARRLVTGYLLTVALCPLVQVGEA